MVSKKTKDLITQNAKDLENINEQRRLWLYASSFVLFGIVLLIGGWEWIDHFHSKEIWWVLTSLMLIISVNWWYWTMRVMLRLINHQKEEFSIIAELINDVRQLRVSLKELSNQEVDKDK